MRARSAANGARLDRARKELDMKYFLLALISVFIFALVRCRRALRTYLNLRGKRLVSYPDVYQAAAARVAGKQQLRLSESLRWPTIARTPRYLIATSLGAAFLLFLMGKPYLSLAQEGGRSREVAKNSSKAKLIARGKYIVEGVAGCAYCHTPRDQDGNPDRAKWLTGAPVFYEPARPMPGWAINAPRLAGLPPGTDAQIITLLTTSVARSGQPPRWPMPRFYMTRTDAEAVVAYLRSLDIGH
jgi:mono/diheme cytochrome c family protein